MEQLIKDLQIINGSLSHYSYDQLNNVLPVIIPQVPIFIIQSDKIPRIGRGLYRDPSIIFRARPNKSKSDDTTMEMPWTQISDISIVPDNERKKIAFGRANKEYQSRFYASNDWHVACYETIWHKFPLGTKSNSQNLTLGIWKIIEPLTLAFIPFSKKFVSRIRKDGQKIYEDIDTFISNDEQQIENILLKNTCDKNKDKFLIDFFSDEFAKLEINCKNDYFLSNFYCDQVFDKCSNENGINDIDGIVFPSVSFAYQSYNIVLHPRSLPKLRFQEAMYVWVTFFSDSKEMQYIPLEQNVKADSTGQLIWNKFKSK